MQDVLKSELHLEEKMLKRVDGDTTVSGIVNLHPTVGTHVVAYPREMSFESYG